jgi:hypothetical protein
MDEFAPAPAATLDPPHPAHCPPWCADCTHRDLGPPGAILHRSPPALVALYDEGCELVNADVRAAFWDKTPEWIGTDPPDLERPHVEVNVPDNGAMQLYLTPGQARAFAAALVRAADAADTEAFYRTPDPPGGLSATAPASAPPHQA